MNQKPATAINRIKQISQYIFVISMLISLCSNVSATPVGLSLGVGTLGPGVSLSYDVNEKFNGRLGINKYNYEFGVVVNDVNYENEFDLNTMSALIDWHPWSGGFRLSGGLVSNSNHITSTASKSNTTIEFNEVTFNLEDAGNVNADVQFDPTVLYLGMGWGNAAKGGGLSFFSDLGIILQGEPKVDITVEKAESVGLTQEDIDVATKDYIDDISQYKYYPVLTFGFAYHL